MHCAMAQSAETLCSKYRDCAETSCSKYRQYAQMQKCSKAESFIHAAQVFMHVAYMELRITAEQQTMNSDSIVLCVQPL